MPSYTNVQSMLEAGKRPDGAIVCTPNQTHVSVAEDLLRNGIHALVEKPLCVDIGSGRSLVSSWFGSALSIV